MAKVSIKSEKITPFGGIFHVRELFRVLWVRLSTKCWVFGEQVVGYLSHSSHHTQVPVPATYSKKIAMKTGTHTQVPVP